MFSSPIPRSHFKILTGKAWRGLPGTHFEDVVRRIAAGRQAKESRFLSFAPQRCTAAVLMAENKPIPWTRIPPPTARWGFTGLNVVGFDA